MPRWLEVGGGRHPSCRKLLSQLSLSAHHCSNLHPATLGRSLSAPEALENGSSGFSLDCAAASGPACPAHCSTTSHMQRGLTSRRTYRGLPTL